MDTIRSISDEIAILLDTKGPEVRTGPMKAPLLVEEGDMIAVGPLGKERAEGEGRFIQVTYDDFTQHVPIGSSILIDDGTIAMRVVSKKDYWMYCRVENSGPSR